MTKAIIDNKSLPPINIKGTKPLRLMRFRLISNTRNIKSAWSTIFQLDPPLYKWFTVTDVNGDYSPVSVSYNAFSHTLTWGPNTILGITTADSTNTTIIQVVDESDVPKNHNLRVNDEVLVQEGTLPSTQVVSLAKFAKKRDGVFRITAVTSNTITIDMGPAVEFVPGTPGLPTGTRISLITEVPSQQVDIYFRFRQSSTVIRGWDYLGRFNYAGTVAIPPTKIPSTADSIDVAIQRPTDPAIRYTVNDGRLFNLTNLVISSGTAEITATGHTFKVGETVSIASNYSGLSGSYTVAQIATNKFYVATTLPNQTSTAITGTAVVDACPVVICKMSLQYKQTIARTGA